MKPQNKSLELPEIQNNLSYSQPEVLRARLLQYTLKTITIGAGLLLFFGAYPMVRDRNFGLLGIAGIIFLLSFVTTNIKSSTYRVRASSLLFVCYAAGFISLFISPYLGISQLWLLCFTAFAVLFFSLGAGILAAFFSGITLIGAGYTVTLGLLPTQPASSSGYAGLVYWLISGFVFVILALIFSAVQYNYSNSWESEAADLRQKNFQLQSAHEYALNSTEKIKRRLDFLQAITKISLRAHSSLDSGPLAEQIIADIQAHFDLYFAGILLVDKHGEQAILKAGTGEVAERMIVESFQLALAGNSEVASAITHGKPRLLRKTGAETVPIKWPYLPESRAELSLPLYTGTRIIGALTLHATRADAFDEEDLEVFQFLAKALAVAMDNASKFQEKQSKLAESEILNRQYMLSSWDSQLTDYIRKQYTYEPPGQSSGPVNIKTHKTPLYIRDQIIGELSLESGESPWTAEEIQLIDAVAAQTAQALETARLIQETQNRAFQEQLAGDFSTRIRGSFNLDTMLRAAVRELGDRLNLAEVEAYIGWEDSENIQAE